MAKKPAAANGPMTIQQAAKMLSDATRFRYSLPEVFRDFVSCAAITLQNGFEPKSPEWDAREAEYLEIVGRYEREVIDAFVSLLATLMMLARDEGYADHLGSLYMALGTNSKGLGQFFTPYHVSRLMATMTLDKATVDQAIAEKGFISVSEPTCGGGGMVVAAAAAIADLGLDPKMCLRITAQDLDRLCCRMTYVACVLHHIPATIIWGDTLKMEERSVDVTPALYIQHAAMQQQPATKAA